jgi:geranylgeranyl reductase family protein
VTGTTEPPTATDVLVVGAGPAGAAAAQRAAAGGHRVTIVERRALPRGKTCGDLLTPRAVDALRAMGVGDDDLDRFHRVDAVRVHGASGSVEIGWPDHPRYPSHALVARRDLLDAILVDRAVAAGARLLDGTEALTPVVERGFVRGAVVADATGSRRVEQARFIVVADGANSRFGRSLGTFREPSWPYATAMRSYWASPRHAERAIEVTVGLADRDGTTVPGYGWVFPLGDGTVNVGIGVVSTARDFQQLNASHVHDSFVRAIADRWEIDPGEPHGTPAGGRLPLGTSVGPAAGPTYLVVGDAAGCANPLTGAGIEYAVESGRMAGDVLDEALREHNSTLLQRYPKLLDEAYGTYFKIGRLVDRLGSRPGTVRRAGRTLARRRRVAGAALRLGANELRPGRAGGAELTYAVASAITRIAPDA